MKKCILGLLMAAGLSAVEGSAATLTYTWVPVVHPPVRNIKPIVPRAWFTVDASAISDGLIDSWEVLGGYFVMATQVTRISSGALLVDHLTGQPVSGSFALIGSAPYFQTGFAEPFDWGSDNPLGGYTTGHWGVTYQP
jgi:hypothetical protein